MLIFSLLRSEQNLKHKVNKNTQQKLYVRHHLKVAFYNEMIRDAPGAMKSVKSVNKHSWLFSFLSRLEIIDA